MKISQNKLLNTILLYACLIGILFNLVYIFISSIPILQAISGIMFMISFNNLSDYPNYMKEIRQFQKKIFRF